MGNTYETATRGCGATTAVTTTVETGRTDEEEELGGCTAGTATTDEAEAGLDEEDPCAGGATEDDVGREDERLSGGTTIVIGSEMVLELGLRDDAVEFVLAEDIVVVFVRVEAIEVPGREVVAGDTTGNGRTEPVTRRVWVTWTVLVVVTVLEIVNVISGPGQ